MKGKRYLTTALLISAVIALSGCGESFPEMTEEEYNQTVEFAVGLLMKYSNNDKSKLTYVNAKEEQKAREKAARKEAQDNKDKAKDETSQTTQTPSQTSTPTSTQTTTTTEPKEDESVLLNDGSKTTTGDDTETLELTSGETTNIEEIIDSTEESSVETPESDSGSEEKDTTVSSDPNALVMSSDESMEVMDGIYLSYQGYSISSTYPESSKSYVINADKGKRLLVLRFDLYNGTDSARKVNLIDKNIVIQVILNDKNLGYTAVTFLPNDLTSYVGTIDSRAHESLVVLTEIDASASTSIQTLGMKVSISGIERDVTLK